MTMRTVNRLTGLEIDEVSLVDRPANQHGLVAITKRDTTGDPMDPDLFDEQGNPYDPEDLQAGMVVFDADGERRVLLDQETADALEAEGVDLENTEEIESVLAELGGIPDDASELEERELASVGKAGGWITGGGSTAYQAGRKLKTKTLGATQGKGRHFATGRVGKSAPRLLGQQRSMGNALLADLSKAYTDSERDRVVTDAFDQVTHAVSKAEQRANRAERIAKQLVEREELATYTEIAKSYDLPVDPDDLGPILRTIAKSGLNAEQLDLVDRVFQAAGEAIFVEKGFSGRNESSIMEVIGGEALELVGKSAGDVTPEQAAVALMSAQAGLYEDYLYEQRG